MLSIIQMAEIKKLKDIQMGMEIGHRMILNAVHGIEDIQGKE